MVVIVLRGWDVKVLVGNLEVDGVYFKSGEIVEVLVVLRFFFCFGKYFVVF